MFVYIQEDGSVGVSALPPLMTDLDMIDDGALEVLHCHILNGDVAVCRVEADGTGHGLPDVFPDASNMYHVPSD